MEKNRELHQLSITDGLTGLYNRKHLMDLFDMEFVRTQRYRTAFSVLIADIDHFKSINDTYGHLAGDAVLRRIADCLRQAVRETDHVGRYGGEEFLIILPATDTAGAMELGQRIRESISQMDFQDNGNTFSMSVSVGVAHCTDGDDSVEAVISRADAALYQAKAGGRNQVIGP
jgi:diguanylate cyclase (GGDEF)-like protein